MNKNATKKLTFEYVENYFNENKCILLENEYINNRTPMKYICICGNESKIRFDDFQGGHRCANCSGNKRYTFEYINDYFKKHGCTLLETKYENVMKLMKYRCICGEEATIRFSDFKRGHRCSKCSGTKKLTFEYAKKYFEQQSCILLESNYVNCCTPMQYICVCGTKSKITFANFKNQQRCNNCGKLKRSGERSCRWRSDRNKKELCDKFRNKCCSLLNQCLKKLGITKQDRTHEILGYNHNQLKEHIINNSNWNKVKDKKWHIDHIFPIKAFIDFNIIDLKIINALDNLQPMLGRDNCIKGGKYDVEEFKQWLKTKIGENQNVK